MQKLILYVFSDYIGFMYEMILIRGDRGCRGGKRDYAKIIDSDVAEMRELPLSPYGSPPSTHSALSAWLLGEFLTSMNGVNKAV